MPPAVADADRHSPHNTVVNEISDRRRERSCLLFLCRQDLQDFPVKRIFQATTDKHIDAARTLFKEYESGLGISLCFQNFNEELKNLPGDYALPEGRLLLANIDDQLAGCIALRKLNDGVCEMKRLFVRPEFRAHGLGRDLVQSIIDEARKLGYTHMRLDTLPGRMDKAIALYQSIGFVEIGPYRENPVEGAKFMELKLATDQE